MGLLLVGCETEILPGEGSQDGDEITKQLHYIGFDRVLSRSSTMQYKNYRPSIPEIAEELNVN